MAENPGRDLTEHIKANLIKGYKEDGLKWALINQGYSRITVERAIKKATEEIAAENNAKEVQRAKVEKPKITYQVYDENNKIIYGKKPFWKRLFRKD